MEVPLLRDDRTFQAMIAQMIQIKDDFPPGTS
jgi:hypothetical protein